MWIQIVLTAIVVAMLPLTMVWVSSDTDKYRKLVWVTLFLTFDLVMFGGFTRLTDSGLGCPDWPGCYGQANPLQAHAAISAAQTAMPTGPVTTSKAWIEMIHRYLAMAVGELIIALMFISWWRRLKSMYQASKFASIIASTFFLFRPVVMLGIGILMIVKTFIDWLRLSVSERQANKFRIFVPTALFVLCCLQGAFGAWTVTLKLQPVIVTTHLLLGLSLLGGLAWLAAQQTGTVAVAARAASLRKPALFALLLLAIQIALGGWVSTNYATLACTDFPMCQGSWIPQMDFANGYTLWRDLGKTSSGEFLSFAALTAIHVVHRTFAFVVFACAGWVGVRALQVDGMQKIGRWLLVALAMQFSTGVTTIYLSWPLLLAVAHSGGAAVLVVLLVMVNYRTRHPVVTVPQSTSNNDK